MYMQQVQPYQPQQVEPYGFLTGTVSVLLIALFAFWVLQQILKVFKGEEIERPF